MIALTPAEQTHFELLTKWRRAMDLVGPGPLEPHFEDAARAVSWLEASGRWADLGSGAGFPGVALAARHPSAQVELVESRRKRATFLEYVVAGLPNARVIRGRSESLEDGVYDGVISRAYRPPPRYLDDAARLLKSGGIVVLMLAREAPLEHPAFTMFHGERYTLGDRARMAVGYRRR